MIEKLTALDAFSRGLRHRPLVANDAQHCGGITVADWQLPWIEGFELLENDDYVIAHHSAGSRTVRAACDGGEWIERYSIPGHISIIPPGHHIDYRIHGAVAFSSLHIPRSMAAPVWGRHFPAGRGIRFAFDDRFTAASISTLVEATRAPAGLSPAYVHAMTRALMLHLARSFETDARDVLQLPCPAKEPAFDVEAVLHYIDAHLDESLSLTSLADHAGVSRSYFARSFRAAVGVSPHRYLLGRRVEAAREMLVGNRHGLADIAQSLGFASQSHFTQVFRSATGRTPSEYRQQQQGQVRAPSAG